MNTLKLRWAAVAMLVLLLGTMTGLAKPKRVVITGQATRVQFTVEGQPYWQPVIQVTKNEQVTNYYVMKNEVTADLGDDFWTAGHTVHAIGTLKTVGTMKELTLLNLQVAR